MSPSSTADGSRLRVALTCDDAPTIDGRASGVRADPQRMDLLRVLLREHGIDHCVAFVIGSRAVGHEERLHRWLEAGYELGNHTFEHLAASGADCASFLESVERCDRLLESVGAFASGASRWFRFPYLDRGCDPAARAELRRGVRDLGYRSVHASADMFDHTYEEPLARAVASQSGPAADSIGARFQDVACRSVRHVRRRTQRATGRDAVHITFFHFGLVSELYLGGVLEGLAGDDVDWCPVSEALQDPVHETYDQDDDRTGLISDSFSRSLPARIRRRMIGLTVRAGAFGQGRLGPRWPYLG